MILDILKDKEKVRDFFCLEITNGAYRNINFSYDEIGPTARVIIKGDAAEVTRLINGYYAK